MCIPYYNAAHTAEGALFFACIAFFMLLLLLTMLGQMACLYIMYDTGMPFFTYTLLTDWCPSWAMINQ